MKSVYVGKYLMVDGFFVCLAVVLRGISNNFTRAVRQKQYKYWNVVVFDDVQQRNKLENNNNNNINTGVFRF